MLEFLTPIASKVGISNPDFAIAAVAVVLFGTFAALGSSKAYSAFYGSVLGVGIYVVLQTLLGTGNAGTGAVAWAGAVAGAATGVGPAIGMPPAGNGGTGVLGPGLSKFLVDSAAYLIPILTVLGPVNGNLGVKGASNRFLRAVESGLAGVAAFALTVACAFGFASKAYVFTADTAYSLLRDSAAVTGFVSESRILGYLSAHLQAIVVFSILYAVYKALFGDIVGAAVAGAFSALVKRLKKGASEDGGGHGGHEDHGGHEEHEEHGHGGHDDGHGHDDHGGHEEHDDHGHGGHGHH